MTEGMSNSRITSICTGHDHTKPLFRGVFPINKLAAIEIKDDPPFFYIFNTVSDTIKISGHWTCVFRNEDYSTNFFDSLGNPPRGDILDFILKLGGAYTHNVHRYQGYRSTSCGEITLFYADLKCQGYEDSDVLNTFSTTHLKLNDSLTQAYVYGHMTKP